MKYLVNIIFLGHLILITFYAKNCKKSIYIYIYNDGLMKHK